MHTHVHVREVRWVRACTRTHIGGMGVRVRAGPSQNGHHGNVISARASASAASGR